MHLFCCLGVSLRVNLSGTSVKAIQQEPCMQTDIMIGLLQVKFSLKAMLHLVLLVFYAPCCQAIIES